MLLLMTGDRVHSFVFGTRLTNVSRHLKHRDVDIALDRSSDAVQDWSGGTRIGSCLKQFNTFWSRRVMSQGAVCILITDGLDREEGDGLQKEMDRLSKSSQQINLAKSSAPVLKASRQRQRGLRRCYPMLMSLGHPII